MRLSSRAGAQPDKFDALFELGVVQHVLMPLLPSASAAAAAAAKPTPELNTPM